MEAVPRLHMLWFALKTSPEGTSFANLKKYIAECYQEDPEAYSKDVHALEMLRNSSMRPAKDMQGCATLKRYYCQLHSLTNRFPQISDRSVFTFTWKDLYQNNVHEVTDLRFEMAAVLFNIAASHTQVGASVSRGDVDGMKLACTHFQCAAWSFGELKEKYAGVNSNSDFMTPELLLFMQQVSFAQAQECILEKSLIDNRKPNIVAKVTAQIVTYYGAALAALMTGGDDGPIGQVIDSSVYKLWRKYVTFKISYLTCILFLYQGQHSEEQQKMGERVTLYQAAWDKLEEARKESKGLPDQKEIVESLTFTADVVEGKRKNAKNENEFIYHEAVPELSAISAVQGANLVNGIGFSVTDPDVAGDDIFGRLVPMKAHEASSMYSEEKAKILRDIGAKIEKNDLELASYMSSLTLDNLNISEEKANKIPQGIVDRCASLNANKAAIPDLIASMSHLAEICAEVETNLNEIKAILHEEETKEKQFQQNSGVHRSNGHLTELTREFQKYSEAHQKAGESNDTLRKAMELHVNNLKILSKPLQEIQSSVPKLSGEFNSTEVFKDLKLILNKVNEMKAQRAQFHADLRIAVNNDDITTKVIAHGSDEGLEALFDKELKKHDKQIELIDANLSAQTNILAALTEAYAKAAPILKTLSDVKHKKDNFFSSLAASFDVYEDLLGKSAKGLEFYKKLSGNVQKLLARVRAAKDVQDEDRQQRIKSTAAAAATAAASLPTVPSSANTVKSSSTPKLKDYLKGKAAGGDSGSTYIPSIRPNPLGSENPTAATCGTAPPAANQSYSQAVGPNEPPPPYSVNQYYDPSGYQNPIYQNTPAPPYEAQSYYPQGYMNPPPGMGYDQPLATQMENMALQQQDYNYGYQSQRGQPYPQYSTGSVSQPSAQSTPSLPSYSSSYANASQSYPSQPAMSQAQQQPIQTGSIPQNPLLYSPYLQQQQPQMTPPPASAPQSSSSFTYQTSAPSQASAPQNQSSFGYQTSAPSQASAPQNSSSFAYQTQPQPQMTPAPASASQNPPSVAYQTPPQPQMTPPPASASQNSSSFAYQTSALPPASVSQNPSSFTYQTSAPPPASAPQNSSSFAYQTNPPQSGVEPTPQSQIYQSPAPSTYQTQYTPETFQSAAYGAEMQPTYASQPTPVQVQDPMQGMAYGGVSTDSQSGGTTQSYSTHPGYSFNPQSGSYEYGSGYQTMQTSAFYGQYTSPLGQTGQMSSVTTDSGSTSKISTQDQDLAVVSHTKQQELAMAPETAPTDVNNVSYYTLPYGYQSNGSAGANPVGYAPPDLNHSTPMYTPSQTTTYMQSGQTNPTQTTASEEYAPSPAPAATPQSNLTPSQPPPQPAVQPTPSQPTPQPPPRPSKKPTSNIDLLTDIDFSIGTPPILPAPVLQPQIASTTIKPEAPPEPISPTKHTLLTPAAPSSPAVPLESPTKRKMSCDNLSIGSDLSSLDHNFDWDSVSVRSDGGAGAKSSPPPAGSGGNFPSKCTADPFADAKTLKYFHKEVERFEKTIETLNVQMLNGSTPLKSKWKELNDLLAKDSPKRTTAIAKLFPEKNRSIDCIPYDHSRVVLETSTDDYINAAYVKDLGPGCPNFIIAQTPQQNTINDFWSMIWSQKARTVLCLHTPNELLDPFWPQEVNSEMHFDDFSVRAVKQNQLSHCTEMNLKLSMNGADAILDLSLIQIKAWTKSSPTQILGIAQNVLLGHKQQCLEFKTNSPLIMNCLTGSERSEQIAVAICAILATQAKRPLLINVVDVWYRICSQRQNALKDPTNLELSMQIILSHAHEVLNKRGIMTSYQMKTAQTVTAKEKEEIKDPLNELDPLWKLKQK